MNSTKEHIEHPACVECCNGSLLEATIEKTTRIKYEGKPYDILVSDLLVLKCDNCGETYLDNRADRQISRALREHLGLMQPEEILAMREGLELTQAQLAEELKLCPESLSRWENGHVIQSRANNDHLQRFFKHESPKLQTAKTSNYAAQSYNPTDNAWEKWLHDNLATHTDETKPRPATANPQYALAA